MSTFELTPEEMELFLTEAAEQVDTMEELLVTLEKGTDPDAVAAIFRAAHTLKGGAATAGMHGTARLTHALESLLDQIRNGQRAGDGETVDALFEAVDLLRLCLGAIEQHGTDAGVDVRPLTSRLEALGGGSADAETANEPDSDEHAPEAPAANTTRPDGNGKQTAELMRIVREAAAVGERVYRVEVVVDDDAPMPSIRLYQTLMVFEEIGRPVQLEPSRDEIEDAASEHFRLEALLITDKSEQDI